jgi:hypothetical protein
MTEGASTTDNQKHKRSLPVPWYAVFSHAQSSPKDKPLRGKRRAIVAGVSVVAIAACWGLGQIPAFAEDFYARGVGAGISRGLSAVSGMLPTSVGELAVVLAFGWWAVAGASAAWQVARRRRRLLNALACGVLGFSTFALSATALFYLLWGVNYLRPPLVERQQWQAHALAPESRAAQSNELAALCEQLVEATNREYFAATGSEDLGAPSAPLAGLQVLDASIEEAFVQVQRDLDLEASFAAPRARAKPVALSSVMNWMHISGFYFPWTGEANYNRLQPAVSLPHVIAHEKAHQRCVTSEDEANFLGFAACIRADDPYVRYSGYLFAQRQLLSELMQLDAVKAQELLKQRFPGVQRDVDDVRRYWSRLEQGAAGAVGKVSAQVNDTYLKLNQVDGGIQSYRMSAKLLIVYYQRQNAGRE